MDNFIYVSINKIMKASFVIPARNEENYISETIQSILNQPRELVEEIIVVNNNSTDRTAQIAQKFPSVIVIFEPVAGTNRARQTGFEKTKSEIVAFLDADVVLPDHWLKRALEIFEKRKKVVAISGPYWYRDGSLFLKIGTVVDAIFLIYPFYILFHYVLGRAGIVFGGNLIVRRDVLNKIGGLDVSFKFWGDDVDTSKRLRRAGWVIFSSSQYIYSSARRFLKDGLWNTLFKYSLNCFWVVFFDKPFTKE